MAIERIDIVVREVGGAETRKTITGIGDAAEDVEKKVGKANNVLDQFKGIIAGLGLLGAAKLLQSNADAYRDITNQLQLVTANAAELATVEKRLFDISQDTNQGFKDTVGIYAQLRQGAAQYGFTAEDTIELTKTLSQALDASGKSSGEAAGAIQQLAKSVAQGEVGGRALVAVFQQVPLVARAIAQSLNVPISQLNNMAQAGQLTGKQLLEALKGSELIAQAAAQEIDTVSDAWTNVKNAFLRYIGQLDQGRGISQAVVEGLLLLSRHLGTLLNLLITAAGAWVAYRAAIFAAAVAQPIFAAAAAASAAGVGAFSIALGIAQVAVGTFVGVLSAAWAILRAHPFIFLATAIGGAITAIVTFGNAIQINGISPLAVLHAALTTIGQAWQQFVAFVQPVVAVLGEVWKWLQTLFAEIAKDQELLNVFKGLLIALGVAIGVSLLPGLAAATAAFIAIGEAVTVINGGSLGEFTTKVIETGLRLKDTFVVNVVEAQKALDNANASGQKFTGGLGDMRTAVDGTSKSIEQMAASLKKLDFGSAEDLFNKNQERMRKNADELKASLDKLRESSRGAGEGMGEAARSAERGSQVLDAHGRQVGTVKTAYNELGQQMQLTEDQFGRTTETMISQLNRLQEVRRIMGLNPDGTSPQRGNWDPARGSGTPAGTATIAYQTGAGVYEAAAMARELLDRFRNAQNTTERTRAQADIYSNLQRIIFQTGNQGGFPTVSNAQQATGLRDLVRALTQAVGISGYANGGAFTVGGYGGGTDSRLVQFMASPGERVSVETPGQYRRNGGGRPIVINMNVATPDANSFRRSETQLSQALMAKLSRAAEMY